MITQNCDIAVEQVVITEQEAARTQREQDALEYAMWKQKNNIPLRLTRVQYVQLFDPCGIAEGL
jgi:hypothetical protein